MGQISSLQVTWQFKNLQDREISNLFKNMMWFVKIPAGIAKNLFNIAKVQRFQVFFRFLRSKIFGDAF